MQAAVPSRGTLGRLPALKGAPWGAPSIGAPIGAPRKRAPFEASKWWAPRGARRFVSLGNFRAYEGFSGEWTGARRHLSKNPPGAPLSTSVGPPPSTGPIGAPGGPSSHTNGAPGGPSVEIRHIVAAADAATARGCPCCPLFWAQTAAAAAAASFQLTWELAAPGAPRGGPRLEAPPPHVALPFLRPLLRATARLSVAIRTAALATEAAPAPATSAVDMGISVGVAGGGNSIITSNETWAPTCGECQGLPQGTITVSSLLEMLLLCEQMLWGLLEALRCSLRGLSRHQGAPQGPPGGPPLSFREIAAIAGIFRCLAPALQQLQGIEATGGGPPEGPLREYETTRRRLVLRGDPASAFTAAAGDPSGTPPERPPTIAAWAQELHGLYREVVGAVLLHALGAPQRPRLPPGALSFGLFWGPLDREKKGGAPTGLSDSSGLLLRASIPLASLLHILAAFQQGPETRLRAPLGRGPPSDLGREGPPAAREPLPSSRAPRALLQLLERIIWDTQGDWGCSPGSPILRKGCLPAVAAAADMQQQRQLLQQWQEQQHDDAATTEVERLVFAAAVLADARAEGGPPKGTQGPFFLVRLKEQLEGSLRALSLVSDALLQRIDAFLTTTPQALVVSCGGHAADLLGGPPPPPLFPEATLRAVLPGGPLGPPGAPGHAAICLLPLLLLQSFARASFVHDSLVAAICHYLVRPLGGPPTVSCSVGGGRGPPRGCLGTVGVTEGDSLAAEGLAVGGPPPAASRRGPHSFCLLDLWPSTAICSLADALRVLEAPHPPFWRFLFSHYMPPEGPPNSLHGGRSLNCSNKSTNHNHNRNRSRSRSSSSSHRSRSSFPAPIAAAAAAATATAAQRSMTEAAEAACALVPCELEGKEAPWGPLLETWDSAVGWTIRSTKRQRRLLRLLLLQGPPNLRGPQAFRHAFVRGFSRCSRRELLQLLVAVATSGAPPPSPEWLQHLIMLLVQHRGSCASQLRAAGAATEAASTADAAMIDAETTATAAATAAIDAEGIDLAMLGFALPYFPPLSMLPIFPFPTNKKRGNRGPPLVFPQGPSEGEVPQGYQEGRGHQRPLERASPTASGNSCCSFSSQLPLWGPLTSASLSKVPVAALPSLLLGLVLHAPPPQQQLQQRAAGKALTDSSSSSSSNSNSNNNSSSSSRATRCVVDGPRLQWGSLQVLAGVLEETAGGLLALWLHQYSPQHLKGAPLAAAFGIRCSRAKEGDCPFNTGKGSPHHQGPPDKAFTGMAAARLCRQSLSAALSLVLLTKVITVDAAAASAAAATAGGGMKTRNAQQHQQQGEQHLLQPLQKRVNGRRRVLLLRRQRPPYLSHFCLLQLLPLRMLRHLLLLLMLSAEPLLWGAPEGPLVQQMEALLAQLHQEQQQHLPLQHKEGPLLAPNVTQCKEDVAAARNNESLLLLQQPLGPLRTLNGLLHSVQHQEQQLQKEPVGRQKLQQQQKLVVGGPSSSEFQREVAAVVQGLSSSISSTTLSTNLAREVAAGPYYIDIVLGAPENLTGKT
ncbi:hypothetical protein, conserved [Eimeria maxima]|uniref:Uncharacterized protein n=1 Tax=Eimeria maxima TaxID=5804 RepID=U6MDX6_EIMMA|nr:hypothetical protein, conserved [Eimeria maxima]CDJ61258.1 hypothetical protein, conserved [Eimeria maxima]